MKASINAKGQEITVVSSGDENDYISLTDIARYKSDDPTIDRACIDVNYLFENMR